MKKIIWALSAAALSACTSPSIQSSAKSEPVDRAYTGIRYGVSGKFTHQLAARAYDANGRVGICAAISESPTGQFMGELTDTLKRKATFFLDDDRILQGAGFASVHTTDLLVGEQAECVVTGAEWKPNYANRKVRISVQRGFVGS